MNLDLQWDFNATVWDSPSEPSWLNFWCNVDQNEDLISKEFDCKNLVLQNFACDYSSCSISNSCLFSVTAESDVEGSWPL